MKLWVFITTDGYYGGWFSGVWESEEKALAALKRQGWKPTLPDSSGEKSGDWQRNYTYGDLNEVTLNEFWGN